MCGGRKIPFNSPYSSKLRNSPYESIRRKDRIENDMGKNDCENSIDARCEEDETGMKESHWHRCPVNNGYIKDDNEWSQHSSSSGKIYYYNRRTEESQWEVPKGWNDRDQESKELPKKERSARESLKESNSREDFREVRDPRGDTKDYKYKEKSNSKDYRVQDSRSFRDSRKNREKDSREYWDKFEERNYRERDSRDYDGKHRVTPGPSKRENVKFRSPSTRSTLGSTTHSRSFCQHTPDSLNGSGSVQDISPPGTPTNDDIVNISTISSVPLYTPHSCSPHISATLTTSRLPLPTTPHTPLLSPVLLTSTGHLSTSYLHPLQQALLLQQQQATMNKDTFGSPKLPTVKNHIVHPGGTTSSSPITSVGQRPVPMVHSLDISNGNATPPPPPPPLKDHNRVMTEPKDRNNTKQERQIMRTPSSESCLEHEFLNRSKTHEYHPGDMPANTTYKTLNSERLIKKTIKLEKEESTIFSPLPELNKYTKHFAPSVADIDTSFYCNSLENQIAASWEETMTMLHSDGYRSKFKSSISRQHVDSQDSKLYVSSGWVDALNAVISKVESLQDSSMKSEARGMPHENKSLAIRKNKTQTNIEMTNENGKKHDMKESVLNTITQEKINTTNSNKETVPNTSLLIVDNEDVLNDIEEMIEKKSR